MRAAFKKAALKSVNKSLITYCGDMTFVTWKYYPLIGQNVKTNPCSNFPGAKEKDFNDVFPLRSLKIIEDLRKFPLSLIKKVNIAYEHEIYSAFIHLPLKTNMRLRKLSKNTQFNSAT